MGNNNEKNSYKTLIAVLSITCALLVLGVGVVICSQFVTPSPVEPTYNTGPTGIEKFATDIEFEYFDNPKDFVSYIEDQTGYDFLLDRHSNRIKLFCTDKDYGVVDPSEHDKIAEYHAVVRVDLTEKERALLEKQIANDERFVENLGDLKVLIGSVGGDNICEYKMVYNMDTKEFNTMPDMAGEYSLITVFYDVDDNYFSIERFNNKYWNLPKSAP